MIHFFNNIKYILQNNMDTFSDFYLILFLQKFKKKKKIESVKIIFLLFEISLLLPSCILKNQDNLSIELLILN